MRILFVDDEKSVLEGIENRLRKYRKVWDMSFSCGGAEALDIMSKEPIDVIVSDMRMPGMDGAELLTQVRERHGDTLRIVLTGQTAKEQILRSLAVAHRVLNKPCDASLLESAISNAYEMQALVNSDKVKTMMNGVRDLPVLPKIYNKLTELIKNSEFDTGAAAAIIEQDPVICGRLLQLVNSSFYGLAREIVSVREAVSYLGMDSLRGLVLYLEIYIHVNNQSLAKSFDIEAFQKHSFLAGEIAKEICHDGQIVELVCTAALLHDIGQLVLAFLIPEQYEEILQESQRTNENLDVVEKRVLGFTHAEVSAYLLSLWDLPFSIIEIVAQHHEPSLTPETKLGPVGVVHFASELASLSCGKPFVSGVDEKYISELGIEAQFNKWVDLYSEGRNHG